jgi:hypothetical protein
VHAFLSFRLFVESLLLYVHITCSPVHTIFHSCSLYFVHSHIQTNKIAGENNGVLTTSVEEEIERCMLVLLFHIVLFCISFILCICVRLVYCMYLLRTFLHNNLSSLRVFLHTNLLHVRCIFPALLHLNKQNGWRGRWTLWRECRRGNTKVDTCTLISYSSVHFFIYYLYICCGCSAALHLFYFLFFLCSLLPSIIISFCVFSCESYFVCCYIGINRIVYLSFTCLSSY